MKKKSLIIIICTVMAILLLGFSGLIIYLLHDFMSDDVTTSVSSQVKTGEYVEYVDPDEYYNENGQVLEKMEVDKTEHVLSESEACDLLKSLGFEDYYATTSYSMKGEYYDAVEIDEGSSDKHPMYEVTFLTEAEDLWMLYITGDEVYAYPVSANMERESEAEIIVSEKEDLLSYDGHTNTYFRTKPKDSAVKLVTVNKIDWNTLNELSTEELR